MKSISRRQLAEKNACKLLSQKMREGFDGGGTLAGVQEFIQDNNIEIIPLKEYEEKQKRLKEEKKKSKITDNGIAKKHAKRKSKKKSNGPSAPNPWNPNNYSYGRIRIVRG